jgi:broad specificity phosphatase PhoE
MKKIKFIRHSKLTHPYDDYSLLSFSEISGLATGRITPNIHPESQKMLLEEFGKEQLKSLDLILCSHSNRTEQTARLIQKLTNKNLEIMKTNNLSEIFFDPEILTNQEEFAMYGLGIIRACLFQGMKNGVGAENLDEVLLRAKKLKKELLALPYHSILCVTHSFYMRVLKLFFLERLTSSLDISELKFRNTIDYYYLKGFEINL